MNALTSPANLQYPAPAVGASLVDLYQQFGCLLNISNEVYHADRSCVSVSGLKQLLRSPEHFQSYLHSSHKETAAMFYGTALHTRVLEPDDYAANYVVTLCSDKRKKEYTEFEASAAGYRILTREQATAIEAINDKLMAHSSARSLLLGGVVEQTLIWQDAETGIWLKIRPDCLNFDFGVCLDLKSTEDASGSAFRRSCTNYQYDIQAAVYLEGLRANYNRDFDFAFLAVEKEAPHGTALYGAPEEMLEDGRIAFRRALRILRQCLDNGEWPGYQPDGGYDILDWRKRWW